MTEMYESSELAQMVERQWKKWLLLTQQRAHEESRQSAPTVTISRERGSGGSSIAKLVAERLGFVLFDSEIVNHVARSAAVDRLVVAQMDEHSRRRIKAWTDRVSQNKNFSAQSYMAHLTKTILTIGEKGQAVIIGRGAHLLLPLERCFRVRVIAPQEMRIQRLASGSGMERSEAEAVVMETDQQRAALIQENFLQLDANPLLYDLVINTGGISLETAAEMVVRAVEAKFPQVFESQSAGFHEPGYLPGAKP
ncbi:MAG: cytidylate kinase-like family protein [Acidobacteria bacterium]|nr:cytidylate kinase-like family protein [Acidobacteriota bacterium]